MRYYRCINCGEIVKSESIPGNVNKSCNKGLLHSFQDLGEIGNSIYECKYCGIRLNFNGEPNKTNDCHKHNFHNWSKASGNLKNITFSTNDSMRNKHFVHRKYLGLLNLVKAGAAGIGIILFGGMILKDIIIGIYRTYPTQFIIAIAVILLLIVLFIIIKIKKRR